MEDQPWALLGEAIVAIVPKPRRRALRSLPPGVHRVPGPMFVFIERFIDSPVGPYTVLSIVQPAFSGLRFGLHSSLAVVNNGDARRVMRQRWGAPAELGALNWTSDASSSSFVWEERDLRIEADSDHRPFPVSFPVPYFQQRADGPVRVPVKMKALVRRASIKCVIEDSDSLSFLSRSTKGWKLSNVNTKVLPARRRRSFSFRAPRPLPEPGVLGMKSRKTEL